MDYKKKLEDAMTLLTEDKVLKILNEAKAEVVENTSDFIILDTICHKGDSHKLYYYKDTKCFMCYTHCGFMSAIDFFKKIWNVNFYDAVEILRSKVGLRTRGFSKGNVIGDFKDSLYESVDILNSYNTKTRNLVQLPNYSNNILERFVKLYKQEWIEDNIATEAMEQFNIRYCYTGDRVVIPHYNIDGDLVGIRSRNFEDEAVALGMKYTPLLVEGEWCNHALGFNLYGIYENQENIRRRKTIVIVEGEKGVLQAETYYGRNDNITVATCGSNLSLFQRDLILSLGVERVYIAFDKQWKNKTTPEYHNWVIKIEKIVRMLSPFVEVMVVWDNEDLLDYKDCLYDKGYEVAEQLFITSYLDINSFAEQDIEREESKECEVRICTNQELEMGKYLLSVGI